MSEPVEVSDTGRNVIMGQITVGQIALILTLLGGFVTSSLWMGNVFATKAELYEKTGGNDVQDSHIANLTVKVSNLELRSIKIDRNVDTLLGRFQLQSAPEPTYQVFPPSKKE